MKANTIDVVERLRSERFEGGIAQWIATMREAADTIELLRAERDMLRINLDTERAISKAKDLAAAEGGEPQPSGSSPGFNGIF